MTREEAIEYWEGLRKTFSSQLEKEENHFGRMHLQTTIDAIDMAISALRQQDVSDTDVVRWISVKDRLPERTMPPHDVLVYYDLNCGMYIDRAWYSREKNKWRNVLGINLKVTHWMPLPEPPEDSANG